jgi:hypothetical protein
MESFHATHQPIRVFALGVPEGWQAAVYDLANHKWLDVGGWIHGTVDEAKIDARQKAEAFLGKPIPHLDWK